MSSSFKNARGVLGTSAADVYECPANTTAIVLLAQISNTTSSPVPVTVQWTDASNSNAITRLTTAWQIPGNQATSVISGKLVLTAGDKLQGYGGTASAIEVSISVLELS